MFRDFISHIRTKRVCIKSIISHNFLTLCVINVFYEIKVWIYRKCQIRKKWWYKISSDGIQNLRSLWKVGFEMPGKSVVYVHYYTLFWSTISYFHYLLHWGYISEFRIPKKKTHRDIPKHIKLVHNTKTQFNYNTYLLYSYQICNRFHCTAFMYYIMFHNELVSNYYGINVYVYIICMHGLEMQKKNAYLCPLFVLSTSSSSVCKKW